MEIYTPEDAKKNSTSSIPDFVFKAFNDLLAEKWNAHSITLKQSDVISKILQYSDRELTANEIINNNWLDVEPVYRANGWKVSYDKPGYCEDHDPFFLFIPKK